MNKFTLIHPFNRHQGFTLVEIMLAITLSLILIAGVVQVYLSSKTSFQVQNQLSGLQENERISVEFLQRDIRQAGFAPLGRPAIPDNVRVVVTNDANGGDPGTADSITVTYTSNKDCLGEDAPGGIATNIYTVDQITNQLMCEGNGNPGFPQPIADGISNMQILLGENVRPELSSYDAQLPSADRYVNVEAIDNMNKVVSVRIAFLVQSAQPIRQQGITQTFTLLDERVIIDSTLQPLESRIKRHVVTTTIPLRNPLFTAL